MAERRPLILLSGLISELPSGDVVLGGTSSIQIVTGSGLEGGNFISSLPEVAVDLLPEPSGLIFVDNKLANDGAAFRDALVASASGNLYYDLSLQVLESGNTTLELAVDALASGNAALELVADQSEGGTRFTAVAAADITKGTCVGFNDAGEVEPIRRVFDPTVAPTFGQPIVVDTETSSYVNLIYHPPTDRFVSFYRGNGGDLWGRLAHLTPNAGIGFTLPINYIFNDTVNYVQVAYSPEKDIFLTIWERNSNSDMTVQPIQVLASTGTMAVGTALAVQAGTTRDCRVVHIRDGYFLCTWCDTAGNDYRACVVQASKDDRCLIGDVTNILDFQVLTAYCDLANITGEDKVVLTYRDTTDGSFLKSLIIGVDPENLRVTTLSQQFTMIDQSSNDVSSVYDPKRRRVVSMVETASRFRVLPQNLNEDFSIISPVGSGQEIMSAAGSYPDLVFDTPNDIFYATANVASRVTTVQLIPSGDDVFTVGQSGVAYDDNTPTYIRTALHPPTNQLVANYVQNGGLYMQVFRNFYDGFNTLSRVDGYSNFVGIANNAASSGDNCTVLMPGEDVVLPSGDFTVGEPLYLDFAGSGVRTHPYPEPSWSGQVAWQPVAQATSASGFLLINQL
jgi:hypothetical protein